jgi:hypothetical protein
MARGLEWLTEQILRCTAKVQSGAVRAPPAAACGPGGGPLGLRAEARSRRPQHGLAHAGSWLHALTGSIPPHLTASIPPSSPPTH